MYEYPGSGTEGNEEMEMATVAAGLHDGHGLFSRTDHLSNTEMIQTIIVIGLFVLSGFFLGRKLFLSVKGKESPGCEKCAAHQISKGSTS